MQLKHGAYYYHKNGKWTFLSKDFSLAMERYQIVSSDKKIPDYVKYWALQEKKRRKLNIAAIEKINREYDLRRKKGPTYYVTARSENIRQRTPKWADMKAIGAIYEEAAKKRKRTGLEYHVDHIIPLNGYSVSGLHVADNLRVISARDNRAKGNKFDA